MQYIVMVGYILGKIFATTLDIHISICIKTEDDNQRMNKIWGEPLY